MYKMAKIGVMLQYDQQTNDFVDESLPDNNLFAQACNMLAFA
jgi:hypothetical protein